MSKWNGTRREFLQGAAGATAFTSIEISKRRGSKRMLPKPTPQQLTWQDAELSMFLHFGVNTFTDREWGDGTESPHIFQPSQLSARQWVQTAKEAGFKYVILTAKHHDGFCLWQSKHTEHSVKNSPWQDGKGDVVREFTEACHEAKMKVGLYLSPWDRHERTYGDSPAYNRHFVNQLTELLTEYGEVAEVWFDGANGEGPNGKRQEYDWHAFYSTIRKHQPKALIAISGPDVRWVGNEDGFAHETEWSVQNPDPLIHPGQKDKIWWPAECDVSIRPGWFWHEREDTQVKSLSHLMDIYYRSVGRNSVLLLNVPPNNRGLIATPDVVRLKEFQNTIQKSFAHDFAQGKPATAASSLRGHGAGSIVDTRPNTYWSPSAEGGLPSVEVDLRVPSAINTVLTQEYVAEGQCVEQYRVEALVEGGWHTLINGTTIGRKKLDRFETVTTTKIRLTLLKSLAQPQIQRVGVFNTPKV
ncbi:MAG: alpha-L-fucosidase [Armatimonadetes bacterium]|nr:alpha-L-fucosidase [Armatimonadota bacterium]